MSPFQKLVDDIYREVEFANLAVEVAAGPARTRANFRGINAGLDTMVKATSLQLEQTRIRDREFRRDRAHDRFEQAKAAFRRAVAAGGMTADEVCRAELELQRIGQRVEAYDGR